MILGFDPGRDKCGLAVMGMAGELHYHQVIAATEAIATIQSLCQQFTIDLLVMGDRTTSKTWRRQLTENFPNLKIALVDEHCSTLEARDRYWQMYPPQGFQRLIPQGMRQPPRPIDDLVAVLLIERYLKREQGTEGIRE